MRRKSRRGVSYVEFGFVTLVMVPLMLGTGAVGVNLVNSFQVIQLARDAGHMYARDVDFSLDGNKAVLETLGSGIALVATDGVKGTSGAGKSVVVLSTVIYVDDAICGKNKLTVGGVHTSACKNFGKWVFSQRIIIGDSSLRTSNYGSPVTTGQTPVTVNATTGMISIADQTTNTGDVATFNSINPYRNVSGVISGLPSGQQIFISEVAARGFVMKPFMSNPITYAFGMF